MAKKNIEVGQNVDAWCTKCKLVLAHTVVAMVGTRPKKVECNTCSDQHVYRVKEPGTRAKKSADGATVNVDQLYKTALEGKDPDSALHYSMESWFSQGDLIQHQTFGLGVVQTLKDTQKIEVVFPDKLRVMIHRRSKAQGAAAS